MSKRHHPKPARSVFPIYPAIHAITIPNSTHETVSSPQKNDRSGHSQQEKNPSPKPNDHRGRSRSQTATFYETQPHTHPHLPQKKKTTYLQHRQRNNEPLRFIPNRLPRLCMIIIRQSTAGLVAYLPPFAFFAWGEAVASEGRGTKGRRKVRKPRKKGEGGRRRNVSIKIKSSQRQRQRKRPAFGMELN